MVLGSIETFVYIRQYNILSIRLNGLEMVRDGVLEVIVFIVSIDYIII